MTKRSAFFFTDKAPQLAGFLIVGAALLCPPFLPAQIPDPPWIAINVRYYDLEGNAGFNLSPRQEDSLLDGSFTEIYLGDSSTPYYTTEHTLGFYEQRPASQWEHWSYTYRCVVPAVGVFEGAGRVTFTESYVSCLPVTSEAVGRTLEMEGGTIERGGEEPGQDFYLNVQSCVTNSFSFAGCAKGVNALGLADHTCSFTVEYLPGNSLESLGSSTVTYRLGGTIPHLLYWGDYDYSSNYSGAEVHTIGAVAPAGPIRVTAFMDGYQVDELKTVAANHYGYVWYPLLRPRPDRPDAKRPPGTFSFEQVPISGEVRRGILDDNARTHVLMDDNLDGVIDIADLVHARGSE